MATRPVGLIRAKDFLRPEYIYLLTNSPQFLHELRSKANSGVQVNLSTSSIKEIKVLMPNKLILQAFFKFIVPLFDSIKLNSKELLLEEDLIFLLRGKLINGDLTINLNAKKEILLVHG